MNDERKLVGKNKIFVSVSRRRGQTKIRGSMRKEPAMRKRKFPGNSI